MKSFTLKLSGVYYVVHTESSFFLHGKNCWKTEKHPHFLFFARKSDQLSSNKNLFFIAIQTSSALQKSRIWSFDYGEL